MAALPTATSDQGAPAAREAVRILVFSASLRAGSLNARLAELASRTIERQGGTVDLASMREFDAPSYDEDVQDAHGFPAG
jgi:NAD(P)H-dependent FMN reductase